MGAAGTGRGADADPRTARCFGPTRDALITAFIAGDLFIVLPIADRGEQDAARARTRSTAETTTTLPDVIVPASFNFPHTGKLLSLSFILFAGWFADARCRLRDYPQLALTGLLTFFGSLNAAVPFLLDLFRIPADTFQLFLATGVINARFGTLVAAVHTLAVALLGSVRHHRAAARRPRRLLRFALITVMLTVATIGGAARAVLAACSARSSRAHASSTACATYSSPSRAGCFPASRQSRRNPVRVRTSR